MDGNDTAGPSGAGADRPDHRSPPPAAAQSKRDRKRRALMEKLNAMSEKMQRDRDLAYRDQLQKIQYEIGLVQRFDPYDANALEKGAELLAEHRQAQAAPAHPESSRTLLDMAGLRFPQFIDQVEDLIEKRDFSLAQAKDDFERKCRQHKNTHEYKLETAKREHHSLKETLRDRLLNSLMQKKARLLREKEAADINDTAAVLQHPSQFTLAIPSSPGGLHGKRATRMRKDVEDINVFPDGKKRKRNPGEDDGSPAPLRRALDLTNTTPLWQSERARMLAKQSGSMMNLPKIFTDKELSIHYNSAAQGAHVHILRNSRQNGNGSSSDGSDSGNGDNADNDKDDADSQPSAPAMERQVSHATRSTRGGGASASANANANANANSFEDRILGIEAITNLELPSKLELMWSLEPPKMPPPVPQQYLKPYPRTADQNTPSSLNQEDINSDLTIMGHFKQHGQIHKPGAHLDTPTGMRKVLQAFAVPYAKSNFVSFSRIQREDPDNLRDALGLPASSLREQPSPGQAPALLLANLSAGAQPMSRQSSQGGVAMSRSGTNGSTRGKGRRA